MHQQQSTNPKQAILERLNQATNILVAVSSNPNVDGLAACLGLTLWLNKIGKHGTAVFSGEVPSTLEFLQPEATLEKNTDSLRDFIIALDKSKADKLRYKVEDDVVKIFITPYRTSLTADDLEYSQGDFNVDMVIALGVHSQEDLDTAITAHGRILHDAAVATITVGERGSELGSINWHDAQASSLSELVVDLGNAVGRPQIDGQIATSLLTGIVAETARFSNEKTTPQTMSVSAELMSAGANQQLVATKLEEPVWTPPEPEQPADEPADEPAEEQPAEEEPAPKEDGTLEIEHPAEEKPQLTEDEPSEAGPDEQPAAEAPNEGAEQSADEAPELTTEPEETTSEVPAISDVKRVSFEQPSEAVANDQPQSPEPQPVSSGRGKPMTEPPALGGVLTANSRPDDVMLEAPADPMTNASQQATPHMLDRGNGNGQSVAPLEQSFDQPATFTPPPADWVPPAPVQDVPLPPVMPAAGNGTLDSIEQSVNSSHLDQSMVMPAPPSFDQPAPQPADVNDARSEVERAINSVPDTSLPPVQSLNAQPIDLPTNAATPPPQQLADQQLTDAPAMPPQPTWQPPASSTDFNPASFDIMNDPASQAPSQQPPAAEQYGPVQQPFTLPVPGQMTPQAPNPVPPTSPQDSPSAPPPVPPPMYPQ